MEWFAAVKENHIYVYQRIIGENSHGFARVLADETKLRIKADELTFSQFHNLLSFHRRILYMGVVFNQIVALVLEKVVDISLNLEISFAHNKEKVTIFFKILMTSMVFNLISYYFTDG